MAADYTEVCLRMQAKLHTISKIARFYTPGFTLSAMAPRLVTRQALIFGGMAAIATTVIMIAVLFDQGYGALIRSDAETFYRVALDPFGDGRVFADVISPDTGTAYRYGRILFPLTAWCLAFGRPEVLRITIPVLYVAAIALVATLAATQSELAGRAPVLGLAALLVPSSFLTVPILVPEFFVAALILILYRLIEIHRDRAALGTAALMLLTRETAVLALAPLMLRALQKRDWRCVIRWATAVIPLLVWYVWLRLRIGVWPFHDPQVPPSRALDLPIRSFLSKAWDSDANAMLMFVAGLGWATILTAAIVAWRQRTFLAGAGVAMASLILVFGPAQAQWPGEAARLMLPAQLLVGVAVISRPRRLSS